MKGTSTPGVEEKAEIVRLIVEREPEQALAILSDKLDVKTPALRVGYVKGSGKPLACYLPKKKCIVVSSSDYLYNPFVILHEFYHHLRSGTRRSKGTERGADAFATSFLLAYKSSKNKSG